MSKTMSKKQHFTIGFDPEVFVAKPNGEIVSSIPVLKRDKHNPIILDKSNDIKTYADNLLLEVSFRPSRSKKELLDVFSETLQKTQKFLGKDYRLMVKSAHHFKDEEVKKAFEIDPSEIGCTPDFDVYKKCIKDLGRFENNMRSGSCHLHVSHPILEEVEMKEVAVRILEIYVGLSSIIWDNDDTSLERRQKYGKAGSFRMPAHGGIEMRCLGNYALNSPSLIGLVYDLTDYGMQHILNGTYKNILSLINEDDVQNAINNCNKQLCEDLLIKASLPTDLFNRVKSQGTQKYNTNEFYREWNIKINE